MIGDDRDTPAGRRYHAAIHRRAGAVAAYTAIHYCRCGHHFDVHEAAGRCTAQRCPCQRFARRP